MRLVRTSRAFLIGSVVASAAIVARPALAAQEDEQLWLQANTNVGIAPRFRVTLEQIARFGDRPGGLFQSELGALFGYRVAEGVELGAGYRYVGFHNRNTARDENRLRQQVVASLGPIFTRFRVDERFHPEGREIGFRVRPLVRYNLKVRPSGLALFVSHESFYLPNSTSWGQRRGYERMRNLVGVTVPVGKELTADIGYLNQYRLGRDGGRAQMDHALSLQVTVNLDELLDQSPHD